MKKFLILLCVMIIVSGTLELAKAELIDRGGGLIYDTDQNITWLQDANYAYTSGYHHNGLMDLDETRNWIDNLEYSNNVSGVVYDDWRLPKTLPVNPPNYNYNPSYNGSTDVGYNITSQNSEMAHLFYVTLGNLGQYDSNGNPQPEFGFVNPSPFINVQEYLYRSDTHADDPQNPNYTWGFAFWAGYQGIINPTYSQPAWAVRDGDVVPHTHCVSNSDELQIALDIAATNSTPDIICIRSSKVPYFGNFVYTSTEPFSLTIKGGYKDPHCNKRKIDPANTVLDADGSGRVLTLDCSEDADLVVDGVKIKNGSATAGYKGGGLYVVTSGNITVSRSVLDNNSTNNDQGGGAHIYIINIIRMP